MLFLHATIVAFGPGFMNRELSRSVYSAQSTKSLPISCLQCGSETRAHFAVASLKNAAMPA